MRIRRNVGGCVAPQLCVCGALVAAGFLWFACSGEDYLDVDGAIACSTTSDCYEGGNYALGTECIDGAFVCSEAGTCLWSTCENGIFESSLGETALDCGGENCDPCAAGKPCKLGRDCAEHICGADKRCTAATCNDVVQNNSETDVDCGSPSCGECPDGAGCTSHAGCQSGVCWAGICQVPDCDDGVENGSETGVDCGGACAPCP